MEPRIQYAQTKDGVNIAFWAIGEGSPLVYLPHPPRGHIQLEWHIPEVRSWYERLARKRMLVRYDGRGSGLSDRNAADYSLDALIMDLEAVADRLELEQFALFGRASSGPIAIAYSVRCPQRVSHLILWSAYARGYDYLRSPRVRTLRELLDKDWELYTETWALWSFGWSSAELGRRYASLVREAVSPEVARAGYKAIGEFDVTDLLPKVQSPTLILHRRQTDVPGLDVATDLAAKIRGARLAVLEGTSGAVYSEDSQSVLEAIYEFLGEGEEAAKEGAAPSSLVTILFTDVEGSTALTQRLGDDRAREVLREHERIVREALKAHGGSELKTTGDGFMASFSSAVRALESAIAMQRAFAQHNQSAEEAILVRVGLNAGEPIAEDEDLFGTAVIAAARIAAQARGGEILASDVVRQLVAGKQFRFASRGRTVLKGLDEAVEVYEVLWQEEGS